MNNMGLAAALIGVAVFFAVESKLRKAAPLTCRRWLLVLAVTAIPFVLFAIYYLHVLPEWPWLYTVRAWRGSEFLTLFAAGAAGALAACGPRLAAAFPLFVFLLIASVPYLKPVLNPLQEAALVDRWRDGVCLQSTASTCGPACLATILARSGLPATEREIARACHTSASGTEAWYLARYARSHGTRVGFQMREGFAPECELPAIVGVRIGGAGHFIAVLEKDGDLITSADPMRGVERLSLEAFRRRYVFTGFHMVVSHD